MGHRACGVRGEVVPICGNALSKGRMDEEARGRRGERARMFIKIMQLGLVTVLAFVYTGQYDDLLKLLVPIRL